MSPSPSIQLLVYAFGPGAAFEGRLVGALERIEAGGALRVLEALFLRREASGAELTAIDVRGRAGGGLTAPLLSFRLDPAARRRATERALAGGVGVEAGTLRELADGLEPGSAVVAVLVEHVWAGALEDAVERTGGVPVADAFVDATELAELTPELLAASRPGNG
jgi:hypothetical protein